MADGNSERKRPSLRSDSASTSHTLNADAADRVMARAGEQSLRRHQQIAQLGIGNRVEDLPAAGGAVDDEPALSQAGKVAATFRRSRRDRWRGVRRRAGEPARTTGSDRAARGTAGSRSGDRCREAWWASRAQQKTPVMPSATTYVEQSLDACVVTSDSGSGSGRAAAYGRQRRVTMRASTRADPEGSRESDPGVDRQHRDRCTGLPSSSHVSSDLDSRSGPR